MCKNTKKKHFFFPNPNAENFCDTLLHIFSHTDRAELFTMGCYLRKFANSKMPDSGKLQDYEMKIFLRIKGNKFATEFD